NHRKPTRHRTCHTAVTFSNSITPLPWRRRLPLATERLPIPHNQPPRLLHIVKPIQRPKATYILLTRVWRQLKSTAQLVRMIAQDAEDGHKIAVNVVVHFYG